MGHALATASRIIVICTLMVMVPALAVAHSREGAPPRDLTGIASRLDMLEQRVNSLEARIGTLDKEKQAALSDLAREKTQTARLRSALSAQHAANAAITSTDPPEDHPRHPSWIGVRGGYTGFPFGQREGGFFYGLFLERELIDHGEGMPYGDLGAELGAAVARSGTDQVLVHSSVAGGPVVVGFRQRMISIWPDLRYRLNSLSDYGLHPYVSGGPGVWVDIIETPPLVGGLQFPTQELAARKLPTTEGASLFEGVQGGAGLEYDLARSHLPLLERMKLGFDYRYSAWTTGQRFSGYSLALSYTE